MLGRSIIISITLFFVALFIAVPKSLAVNIPSFPSCVNPQGEIKVSYESGTHGIPGDLATYSGKDTVYKLSDETLAQCFCAANGDGIQTNWWKVSSLSDPDIQTLKNQGWNYIPNGSLWGLESVPYLAKNSTFSCKGGVGGGEVLGASTTATKGVLGLASTGNALYIVSVISSGLLLLAAGSILSIKKKK